jgi:hypothetical protein
MLNEMYRLRLIARSARYQAGYDWATENLHGELSPLPDAVSSLFLRGVEYAFRDWHARVERQKAKIGRTTHTVIVLRDNRPGYVLQPYSTEYDPQTRHRKIYVILPGVADVPRDPSEASATQVEERLG